MFFSALTLCCLLTVGVGEAELVAGALLEHVVGGHVALQGHQLTSAARGQQTHAPVQDGLHGVGVGG